MGILCLGGMYLYGIVLNLILVAYGQSFWHTFFSEYQYGGFHTLLHSASPGTLILDMVSAYAEGRQENYLQQLLFLVLYLESWHGLHIRKDHQNRLENQWFIRGFQS